MGHKKKPKFLKFDRAKKELLPIFKNCRFCNMRVDPPENVKNLGIYYKFVCIYHSINTSVVRTWYERGTNVGSDNSTHFFFEGEKNGQNIITSFINTHHKNLKQNILN